ncbi:MAG TPA: hypothetical protein VFE54_01605, partial [Mucilaginibacter sp.]|nr:hypothetical protein [Mucilaginibacter sp.]
MEHTLINIVYFALLNLVIVLPGYVFLKKKMVLLSWAMLLLVVLLICFIFKDESPIIKMLAIIATTFSGMKVIAATVSYSKKRPALTFTQWFVFAVGWVGMQAHPFENLGGKPIPGSWQMIRFGISRVFGGALLILIAHLMVRAHLNHTLTHISVSILLLVGFSLILHFGLLSISAGTWRLSGVNTYYLFR